MAPILLENRCMFAFLCGAVVTFALLDTFLWLTFLKTDGPLPVHLNSSSYPCTNRNPICLLDVKSLMMDWGNFYVHCPLSIYFYHIPSLETCFELITANCISFAHVFIAALAARLICHDSLCVRRLGVVVYEVRNFLDAVDGTVARAKRAHATNIENLNTSGYYVDGICDGLGCVFLLAGCCAFLRKHPKKSFWYQSLPTTVKVDGSKEKYTAAQPFCLQRLVQSISSKACKAGQLPIWLGIQWLVNSICWNRYIARFTYLLENSAVTNRVKALQANLARTPLTCCVFISWRLVNVHANLELLLVAIFFDKLAEFLYTMYSIGWLLLLQGIVLGEIALSETTNALTRI